MSGAVIDFGISYLGIEKIHLAVWVSTIISTESAIISNFILNNYWRFAHESKTLTKLKNGPAFSVTAPLAAAI